ncbi:PQ loop repeat protein [Plectosphaerella plurivora]|uniref:PQ loop repeat protein n=1 Tax=Plectosphaerella plurivora TaxID=936078 RepID=A0A9P9AAB2_9PEZI|nr:PQ loop repeat protein [Plectosphaerella plurivora]
MWLTTLTGYVAPFFIIMSPILSYSDQAISMHRNKSSAGFSLDIPLIMLVASILKLFYWPEAHFDNSLLIQAIIMIVVQVILLKIALDHRLPPSSKGGEAAVPFALAGQEEEYRRPFDFWQWRTPKPYWHALFYFVIGLFVIELFLVGNVPLYEAYSIAIGYIGLATEAILPIPQIMTNMRSRSCRGFRLSLLASWLIGDTMKMFWFFTATTEIPMAFKIGGMFQASCDAFLGIQYWMYGEGTPEVIKEHPLTEFSGVELKA